MMRNVKRVVGRDGVVRLYFQRAGEPRVRLHSPPDSEALAREVEALRGAVKPRPLPGILRHALRAYELECADYAILADQTKTLYQAMLKELDEDFGQEAIATFKPPYLLELRNLWAARGYRAANLRLQVLHNVLKPCIIAGQLGDGDPFTVIPNVPRPHALAEPHQIWPDDVLAVVVDAAIARKRHGLARGVAIGRYAGARRSDIVGMTKGARKAGRIAWLSGKRKIPVDMPEDPALTAIFARTPDPTDSLVLAYNRDGFAYSEDGFALELGKLIDKLAEAKQIPHARFGVHGLRHTFGVEGARAGWTDADGAAMMGHGSPHSFAPYRRQAQRSTLADNAAEKVTRLRAKAGGAQ